MNRVSQQVGAEAYQTFQVVSPTATHTRVVSCEEARCEQYARGWRMKLDLGTPLGLQQARYVKNASGRSFRILSQRDGLVELEFRANQPCFQEHRASNGRPEVYRVKGGDHRGNPLKVPTRVHKKPEFWLEEFQQNQARIAEIKQKG